MNVNLNPPKTILIRTFEKKYEASAGQLLAEIQLEFPEKFTAPDSSSLADLAEHPGSHCWVALLNDKVIGTAGLTRFSASAAIIKRLFVHKAHRGPHGIARTMLNTVLSKARAMGVENIYLGTMAQFTGAQKFYLKNNFVQIQKEELPEGMTLSVLDTVFFRRKLFEV